MTNCAVTGNTATADGGGICAEKNGSASSSVTINGGIIGGANVGDANTAGSKGGGMYVKGGTVDMSGCTLKGNTAENIGGAVYVDGGTVNITDCTLTGNSAKNGGGIYTEHTSSDIPRITIKGGTIGGTEAGEANKATGNGNDGNGGGIYIGEHCEVRLENNDSTGCIVTGNTATGKGGGVYVKNTILAMKGSATVTPAPDRNDVYLTNGTWITVDDPLTPQGGIAARITVHNDNYQTGTKVLAGDKVGTEYTKFVVTPNGNKRWTVKSDGTLSNTLADIFANITKDQIEAEITAAEVASSTIYKEGDSINPTTILNGKLVLYRTGKRDYGIMHVTEVNNTSNGGGGHIKFNYKTFRTYSNDTLQNSGEVVNGDANFDLDSGGSGASGNDFHLGTAASQFKILDNAKFYILPN